MNAAAIPAGEHDDGRMSLIDHLVELRDRLIKCAVAIAIGGIGGFMLYNHLFAALIQPYKDLCEAHPSASITNCKLLAVDPLEGFTVRLKIATYSGIGFAMPVLLWQLWRFIAPGLYKHERRLAFPFVGSALALFVMGAGLAYWTMPKALSWLQGIGGDNLVTGYSPAKYFQLISYYMLAFGVGFEFPVLLVFLQMVGVLKVATLRKFRRYALVGITIVVAVITPSGDPITMLALSVPMCIFYEFSIIIGRLMARRKAKASVSADA
jgi:sec-independent protein translocase protein TatC